MKTAWLADTLVMRALMRSAMWISMVWSKTLSSVAITVQLGLLRQAACVSTVPNADMFNASRLLDWTVHPCARFSDRRRTKKNPGLSQDLTAHRDAILSTAVRHAQGVLLGLAARYWPLSPTRIPPGSAWVQMTPPHITASEA